MSGNTKVWRRFAFPAVTTSKIRVLIQATADGYSRVMEVEAYEAVVASGGGGVSWLVNDQLGTPRMVVDQTGSLSGVKRHDYLPFGEEITAGVGGRTDAQGYKVDTVRQHFTGYERDDETGLDFAQARYYGSTMGRFASPDPLLASAKPADPQTWNRYTYALNNPLLYTDSDGLSPIWIHKKDKDGNLLEFKRIDSEERGNYSSDDGWSDVSYDSKGQFSYVATTGDGEPRTAILTNDGNWHWSEPGWNDSIRHDFKANQAAWQQDWARDGTTTDTVGIGPGSLGTITHHRTGTEYDALGFGLSWPFFNVSRTYGFGQPETGVYLEGSLCVLVGCANPGVHLSTLTDQGEDGIGTPSIGVEIKIVAPRPPPRDPILEAQRRRYHPGYPRQ